MALADKRLPSVGWPPALAERGHFEHRIIPALRRQAPWIAISALLVLGFSAVLTARQVPVYSASVARMNPCSKSVWMTPAACGAVLPLRTVQARTSLGPAVK